LKPQGWAHKFLAFSCTLPWALSCAPSFFVSVVCTQLRVPQGPSFPQYEILKPQGWAHKFLAFSCTLPWALSCAPSFFVSVVCTQLRVPQGPGFYIVDLCNCPHCALPNKGTWLLGALFSFQSVCVCVCGWEGFPLRAWVGGCVGGICFVGADSFRHSSHSQGASSQEKRCSVWGKGLEDAGPPNGQVCLWSGENLDRIRHNTKVGHLCALGAIEYGPWIWSDSGFFTFSWCFSVVMQECAARKYYQIQFLRNGFRSQHSSLVSEYKSFCVLFQWVVRIDLYFSVYKRIYPLKESCRCCSLLLWGLFRFIVSAPTRRELLLCFPDPVCVSQTGPCFSEVKSGDGDFQVPDWFL
jgi:hypothetical protein